MLDDEILLYISSCEVSMSALDVSLRINLSGGELCSFPFFKEVPRLNVCLMPDTKGTAGARPLATIYAIFCFSKERALARRRTGANSRMFFGLTLGLISPYYETAELCFWNFVGERLFEANAV